MITKKKLLANRRNIKKALDEGKTKHYGESNPKWKGGITIKGNYPCPVCKKELFRAKRYSELKCLKCSRIGMKRKQKTVVGRPAYYYRARAIIKATGRIITSEDHVHHKNGNWTDNRIENLEVVSKYEHRKKYHNPSSKDFIC